jgi:hypothetical protein
MRETLSCASRPKLKTMVICMWIAPPPNPCFWTISEILTMTSLMNKWRIQQVLKLVVITEA